MKILPGKNRRPRFMVAVGLLLLASGSWLLSIGVGSGQQYPAAPGNLTIVDAPMMPPVVGPQSTITCPVGAIPIWPGTAIQPVVDIYPGNTAFCLRTGLHAVTSAITPKSGDIFTGEYGAVLDGAGWTTSEPEQGAFRAHNQDIDDVTIRNLVIQHMPQRGIHAYSSGWCESGTCHFSTAGADRWTIEYNEIADNITGLTVPNYGIVRHNYIHHNVGPDPSGAFALRGGGVNVYLSQSVLFEDNEISFNGSEMKMASLSPNTVVRHNFVHHNNSNGIWYDGENTGSIIEGNLVEDNAGVGIFYEVSGQGIIRDNTIRRNGDNGILISMSHDVEISGNIMENNRNGILYYANCASLDAEDGGWIGERFYMQNVAAHDNTIIVGTGRLANGFSYTSCSAAQLDEFIGGSKHLTFSRNIYRVPSVATQSYWLWPGFMDWPQWQAIPQDATSTVDGVRP